jgi:hypothetical protein
MQCGHPLFGEAQVWPVIAARNELACGARAVDQAASLLVSAIPLSDLAPACSEPSSAPLVSGHCDARRFQSQLVPL